METPKWAGSHAAIGEERSWLVLRRERLRALLARVGASPWAALGVRAMFFVGAILVFAWIGRATAATRPASLVVEAGAALALDAGTAPAPPVVAVAAPPPSRSGRATPEAPVYVNHADADELRRLPGVGAKRAEAILALRSRVGRFQRVEDLLRVKGVGRGTLRKWRPLVRLEAPEAGTR